MVATAEVATAAMVAVLEVQEAAVARAVAASKEVTVGLEAGWRERWGAGATQTWPHPNAQGSVAEVWPSAVMPRRQHLPIGP